MRRLVRLLEVADERLRVRDLEVDDPREIALELRIVRVEPLGDEERVIVVLGEDDRLAETVASGHADPARHQVRQHLVDSVLVE